MSSPLPPISDFPRTLTGTGTADVLRLAREFGVEFLRLQFTDILGVNKGVEMPRSQFAKAVEGEIMFDGSSIEGFVRIEESDMLLAPDLNTFRVLPEDEGGGRVGRLLCDIYTPDHQPFDGCPRLVLKRMIQRAARLGYSMMAGCEVEFFLFEKDTGGGLTTITHGEASYFDLTPVDKGEEIRRLIVTDLELMGFEVEAAIMVAPGQPG
jgi:glutamine synthetase